MLKTFENQDLAVTIVALSMYRRISESYRYNFQVAYMPHAVLLDRASFEQYVTEIVKTPQIVERLCTQVFSDLEGLLDPVALRVVISTETPHGHIACAKEKDWGMDADTLSLLREAVGWQ